MEFLRVVEEELRGLAGEARRRHPVVQEAAERQDSVLSWLCWVFVAHRRSALDGLMSMNIVFQTVVQEGDTKHHFKNTASVRVSADQNYLARNVLLDRPKVSVKLRNMPCVVLFSLITCTSI